MVEEVLDDEVHYCKKCNKALEEGRAFELGKSRWHVECFTCSKCGSLMDCDSNLLVLGDGSLICNNCSYSCYSCNKKIEDLAILTGDVAYCSSCFRCRNCKKKIEDLRYARTYQGIFCMSCHEALIARKKRSRQQQQQQQQQQQRQQEQQKHGPSRYTLHQKDDGHSSPRPSLPHNNSNSSSSINSRHKSADSKKMSTSSSSNRLSMAFRDKSLPQIPLEPPLNKRISTPPEMAMPKPNRSSMLPSKRETLAGSHERQSSSSFGIDSYYHGRTDSESSNQGFLPIKLDESTFASITITPDSDAPSYETDEEPEPVPKNNTNHSSNHKVKRRPVPSETEAPYFSGAESNSLRGSMHEDSAIVKENGESLQPPINMIDERSSAAIEEPKTTASSEHTDDKTYVDDSESDQKTEQEVQKTQNENNTDDNDNDNDEDEDDNDDDSFEKLIPERSILRSRSPSAQPSRREPTTPQRVQSPSKDLYNKQTSPLTSIHKMTKSTSAIDVPGEVMSLAPPSMTSPSADELASPHNSLSPSALTKIDQGLSPSQSGGPVKRSLTKDLIESKKRIAELERELSERRSTDLVEDLKAKRKTIAGLQAQEMVARKELEVLAIAKENKADSVQELISVFKSKVVEMKQLLQLEISDLYDKKEELLEELKELNIKRDKAIEESSLLNIKNTQLADMNNELQRQLIGKFGSSKVGKEMSASESFPSLSTLVSSPSSTPNNHSIGMFNHSNDEPMVTILEAGQVVDTRKDRQHARRFWKRPGAAVAKGLTKVFANEEQHNIGASGAGNSGTSNPSGNNMSSVTDLTQPQFANGNGVADGLGISFPKDAKQKSGRNGWFNKSSNSESHQQHQQSSSTPEKSSSALMGSAIEKRIELEGTKVPIIVTKCIEEVEKRGISYEGIYRKSGGKSQITTIEEVFEKCQESKYDEVLSGDISGVTSALKQYLRYLPVPLITFDVYEDFVKVSEGSSIKDDVPAKIDMLRNVVNDLPQAHRDCLEVVIRHLVNVTNHSSQNLMNSKNLAVVFAPTLAWHTTGEREILDMQKRNDGTQLMIDNCEAIFNAI
ncbi:rho-type GTPase-activating protein 2 [Trichomonascus vanleenenianus]|uniref:GTPase-activating protein RGA2 n=1 Tax=Trichomonascus vanleenenianus TaxID=2268995 RepID=UPI003ECADEAD